MMEQPVQYDCGSADVTGTGTRYGVYGTAVGGATNYGVYCAGNGGYTGTWVAVSDEKFKKNFEPINGALGLINQLQPTSYEMKTNEFPSMNFPTIRQYGFIAQDLEKVIPLLVEKGVAPGVQKDQPIDYKGVNYIGLIPVLTQAIKEQQQQIEDLKKISEQQQQQIQLLLQKMDQK
jgi:hypothetical protein